MQILELHTFNDLMQLLNKVLQDIDLDLSKAVDLVASLKNLDAGLRDQHDSCKTAGEKMSQAYKSVSQSDLNKESINLFAFLNITDIFSEKELGTSYRLKGTFFIGDFTFKASCRKEKQQPENCCEK